jgi:hypothetical protein
VGYSTIVRMLQPLRDAGLAPMGVRGRGETVGVYEPHHLSYVILGLGGLQPSDAAEAAESLRHLQWKKSIRQSASLDAPRVAGDLSQVLTAIIAGDLGPLGGLNTPCLVLGIEPPEATIIWPDRDGHVTVETYGPPENAVYITKNAGIVRHITINGVVLDAAIALWRDRPRNYKAGGLLPGRSPALTFVRHKAERSVEHSDSTTGRFAFQLRSDPGAKDHNPIDSTAA